MNNANGSTAMSQPKRMVTDTRRTSPAVDIHPTPPHSVEAEQGVLGSCLLSVEAILEAQEMLTAEYFYVPAHQTIWDLIVDLTAQKKKIDLITFTQELRDRNLLESVGGAGAVTNLFTCVPMAANLGYYIDIVRDKFVLRSIIAAGTEAVRRAYEEQDDVRGLLDQLQSKVTTIALDKIAESPGRQIKDDVLGVIEEFENAYKHRGRTQGLSTGFVDLDRMTSGLHPSEMIVIAARPSMGKTALAMDIAENVALPRGCSCGKVDKSKALKCPECEVWNYPGQPVWVFSLETSRRRLVRRMLCGRSHVSIQKMRDGFLAEADFPRITAASEKLMEAPIYVDDTPSLRINDFKSRSRYAVVQLSVVLIVIDYVQLMTTGWKAATSPYERQIELTKISATIKEVCRELNVPIIVLAQLNRDAEKNQSGRPRMSNLRECGALEQDADLIGLIYRPEYYETDEEAKQELAGEAELIIAKQKDGPVGTVNLTFLKEFTRFEDRAAMIDDEEVARPMYSNNPDLRQDSIE